MGAAAILCEELKKKGVSLIDEWVKEAYREDLHLDFKRKTNPEHGHPDDNDKKNISKALSGFANSDGGLIVWGIDAPSGVTGARAKAPITDVALFAEHLDSLASRLVVPVVEGVENIVVYQNKRKQTGYVVTYIPVSPLAPHRAEHHATKKYFQRSGESFVQLEHWQLEYMFGRRQVPVLKLVWDVIPISKIQGVNPFTSAMLNIERGEGKNEEALLRISIQNKGRAIAKYSCLRIHFKVNHERYRFNQRFRHNLIDYGGPEHLMTKPGMNEVTARARPGLVVYPADRLVFFEFRFNYGQKEAGLGELPDFNIHFDLFAENVRGIIGRKLSIPGSTISRILAD